MHISHAVFWANAFEKVHCLTLRFCSIFICLYTHLPRPPCTHTFLIAHLTCSWITSRSLTLNGSRVINHKKYKIIYVTTQRSWRIRKECLFIFGPVCIHLLSLNQITKRPSYMCFLFCLFHNISLVVWNGCRALPDR